MRIAGCGFIENKSNSVKGHNLVGNTEVKMRVKNQ